MDSLHNLVAAQKVLYLGVSDTPAWVVSQANQYAVDHGKTPFVVYQGKWSILERSFEREIIPMARSLGMALSPFGVLGQGKLRTDAEEESRKEMGEKGRSVWGQSWERTEVEVKVCKALEKVAAEVGVGSNITAGESESFSSIVVCGFLTGCVGSGDRICDAQDAVRLPNHRRTKSGAPRGEFKGAGHLVVQGAD